MQSRDLGDHDITIAFLFRRELRWARSYWRCVSNLWNGWKNLLPVDKKVRRKNQIPEYHVPSPGGTIRTIRNWSINEKPPNPVGKLRKKTKGLMSMLLVKNLLTQWDSWGGKPRADKVRPVTWPSWFDEKPPNPNGRWGRKTERFWNRIRVIQGGARLYFLL